MRFPRGSYGFAAFFLSLVALPAAESGAVWPSLRVERAPVIDGVLDDAVWADVPVLKGFRQAEPTPGAEPSEETEVRIINTATHIYFSVVAHDREPGKIVATQRKRDADLTDDDHVTFVFDPFLDRRNGYLFSVNPLGARRDALIEGGKLLNANWDGLWSVATKRTADGWVAEGEIPLSTLSFNPSASAWGLNIERRIARRDERVRWRGHSRQYAVNSLAETGQLTELGVLRRGLGIEFRPYASLTYLDNAVTGKEFSRLKPGFDLSYKLTDATTTVLTINTDFADAEVDERQVNLTRFPISFPEKRAFFLQDAGIFSFSLINSSPLPFNSRRIGIGPKGEVVDLLGGVRVSGREGPINFGMLAVRMDDSGALEAKDLGVARVSANIWDQSSVGIIATSGDPSTNGNAALVGADFNFYTSSLFGRAEAPFQGSIWVQHTDSSARVGDGGAYGYEIEYDSPTVGLYSFYEELGDAYNPAMGFVKQVGIWQGNVKADYEFNPEPFKRIVPVMLASMRYSNVYDAVEYETYGPDVSIESKRGDILLLRARTEHEVLPAPFRVANGVVVRPGDFEGEHLETSLTLSKSRPLSFSTGVAHRLYYAGDQTIYKNTLTWRPSPIFNLDTGFDYTAVKLPYAEFPVRLLKVGATVQFSPTLVWSVLTQYDNLSKNVGVNSRIRWTYAPGGDIFFVVNQGIDTTDDRWDLTRTELSTKVGATYRF
ncbi:MAG: hypothetical protein RL376_1599 [Verrucomicrobiota bacterium]|jgi:hypothetical protein